MRARLLALGLVVILGCSGNSSTSARADYTLSEGTIDGPSRLVGSGPATIRAANVGEYSHTLVVTNDQGEVISATDLVESGHAATLVVDLDPGTYVFSCRIVAEDNEGNLVDHYESGMHRTVTVDP